MGSPEIIKHSQQMSKVNQDGERWVYLNLDKTKTNMFQPKFHYSDGTFDNTETDVQASVSSTTNMYTLHLNSYV